jgi:hypothetical protein
MTTKQKPAPVKVTVPNGPTFVLNDIAEFAFDPQDAEFVALHQAYMAARDARQAYLDRLAKVEFRAATSFDLPTGYVIKAGLSKFGGASQGKAWAVIDRVEKAKPATAQRGFSKWSAA